MFINYDFSTRSRDMQEYTGFMVQGFVGGLLWEPEGYVKGTCLYKYSEQYHRGMVFRDAHLGLRFFPRAPQVRSGATEKS